jgi:DNA-dependent RNA polymerase auxiliary subunit epsilon
MNIYVDENIPQKIATRLKAEGYRVEYVTRSVEDQPTFLPPFTYMW